MFKVMATRTTTTCTQLTCCRAVTGSSPRPGWRTGCQTWRYSVSSCPPSSTTIITPGQQTTSTSSQPQTWPWCIMTRASSRTITWRRSLGIFWNFNRNHQSFLRTMFDNECNILSNLSKHDYQQVRSMLIETVLGTGIRNPKWFVQVLTSIHHLYFARHVASFPPVASYTDQSQQQDQGDVLCAPLGGRGPPLQGLGPA